MESMKELQKAVKGRKTSSEEEISFQRHTFERAKADLEALILSLSADIEASKLDVLTQGSKFG